MKIKQLGIFLIKKTKRYWLLCRELSIVSILLSLLSIFIFIKYTIIGFYYLLFVIGEYLTVRYCAKNMAERLVVNTLAFISASKE